MTTDVGRDGQVAHDGSTPSIPRPRTALLTCRSRTRPGSTVNRATTTAKTFWEHASGWFSHISYDNHVHKGEAHLIQTWDIRWFQVWSSSLPQGASWLRGKRVGEWGVGGGLLGQMLCERHGIAHYVAFDIAERQLKETSTRLARTVACPHDLVLASSTSPSDTEFKRWNLDVLISQQVIQHFPTEQYTVDWLCTLAAARIPRLLLEVRRPPYKHGKQHELGFANWGNQSRLKSTYSVQYATYLNCNYLLGRLQGYHLDAQWTHTGGSFDVCALSYNRSHPHDRLS